VSTHALDDFGMSAVDRRDASRLIAPAIEAGWWVDEVQVRRLWVFVRLVRDEDAEVVLSVGFDRDFDRVLGITVRSRWDFAELNYPDLPTALAALGGAQ
jgi:hypothetical protein